MLVRQTAIRGRSELNADRKCLDTNIACCEDSHRESKIRQIMWTSALSQQGCRLLAKERNLWAEREPSGE